MFTGPANFTSLLNDHRVRQFLSYGGNGYEVTALALAPLPDLECTCPRRVNWVSETKVRRTVRSDLC